jgi:hypothetical protein
VFLYNEPIETLENPYLVILFELIDQAIHHHRSCFTSIAWAFLKLPRPDSGHEIFGQKCVLQLHAYPSHFDAQVSGNGVLPVLSLLTSRVPIAARLTVAVDRFDASELPPARALARPRSVFDAELEDARSDAEEDEDEEEAPAQPTSPVRVPVRECQVPRALAAQIPAGEHGVLCLRFNNAGTVLAAALQVDGDFAIQFYDTERLVLRATFRAHINLIYEIAFAPDDRHLLSVSSDGMAKVWATDPRELRRALPHSHYLYSGKFHPKKDQFVATAGFDGIMRVWNRVGGVCVAESVPHASRVNSVVFSPDGERVYSGDAMGVICVWRFAIDADAVTLVREQEVKHREIEGIPITHLSMGRGAYALLVYTQDSLVRNFETEPMEVVQRFTGAKCTRFMMEAGFSPDQKYVFAGSENGSVMLWLVKNREPVQIAQWTSKFTRPVTSATWNPVKDMVAFGSFAPGQGILVFDLGTNQAVRLRARKVREQHPLPP